MAAARSARPISLILVVLFIVGETIHPQPASAAPAVDPLAMPDLGSLRAAVLNGNRKVVVGVYADQLFALPVVQQVCAMCVSREEDTVTQFSWAAEYGVTGLIAHDYLSGKHFYDLEPGQRIELIYGDGRIEFYWITEVGRYRQTESGSETTGYVDLATGKGYSVEDMFRKVYMGTRHVTFQTCITKDGNLSWGMLFAIAERSPYPLRSSFREAMQPAPPWWRRPLALPL